MTIPLTVQLPPPPGGLRDPQTGVRLIGTPPADFKMPRRPLLQRLGIIRAEALAPATVVDALYPDLSHWDADTIDPPCFWDHGIRRACVQADVSGRDIAQALQAQGITVDCLYCFPYFSHTGTQPQQVTSYTVQLAIDLGVPIVMFDAELDNASNPPTVADRQRQTRESLAIIRQGERRQRVYSAPWFWVPNLANTPEFREAGADFMLANYGHNDGTQPPIRELPGFAWPYCTVHQYWSLADYCGRVSRDMSYVWSDALPEDEPMTPTERAEFDQVKRELLEARRLIAMNGYGRTPTGEIALSGEPAWEAAVADGSSLFLSLGDTETDVRKLQQQPPGLKQHTHDLTYIETGGVHGLDT